jgi:hypothetical protein
VVREKLCETIWKRVWCVHVVLWHACKTEVYLFKGKEWVCRITMQPVCLSVLSLKLLNNFIDYHKTVYDRHAIEVYSYMTFFLLLKLVTT